MAHFLMFGEIQRQITKNLEYGAMAGIPISIRSATGRDGGPSRRSESEPGIVFELHSDLRLGETSTALQKCPGQETLGRFLER